MKTIHKFLTTSLILGLAAFSFAACGKKPAETTAAPETSVTETTAAEIETEAAEEEEDYGVPYYEYEGTFISPERANDSWLGADITITPREDHFYDVEAGIIRLCSMSGVGNFVDGGLEIVFDDPNGETMCAILFPEEDGTFTLRITQSKWTYIHEGDDFTGFVHHKVIRPQPMSAPLNELNDASIQANFKPSDFSTDKDDIVLKVEAYNIELFDVVDLHQMQVGDTLVIGDEKVLVDTISNTSDGFIINGGIIEENGYELVPNEGGTYVARFFDDYPSFSYLGTRSYPLAADCKLEDGFELGQDPQIAVGTAIPDYINHLDDFSRDYFIYLNTTITIEDGKITNICRIYTP